MREQANKPAATPEGVSAAAAAKHAALSMLVALSRQSPELAQAVASQGGLEAAVECLADTDADAREAAGAVPAGGLGWDLGLQHSSLACRAPPHSSCPHNLTLPPLDAPFAAPCLQPAPWRT